MSGCRGGGRCSWGRDRDRGRGGRNRRGFSTTRQIPKDDTNNVGVIEFFLSASNSDCPYNKPVRWPSECPFLDSSLVVVPQKRSQKSESSRCADLTFNGFWARASRHALHEPESRRSRDRKVSVICPNGSLGVRERCRSYRGDIHNREEGACRQNINDAVDGANFVEVDILEGGIVCLGLSKGQMGEGQDGTVFC